MVESARLLVVSGADTLVRMVRFYFTKVGYEVDAAISIGAALSQVHSEIPRVVICEDTLGEEDALAFIRQLRASPLTKGVPVLVLIDRLTEARRVAALEAGANDVASREAPIQQIADRVAALVATAVTTEEAPQPSTRTGAHTITILGARGGSGKTLLAANLGASMAQQRGQTAVLLDLNLEFGTSAYMLNLRPHAPLNEIADAAAAGASDAEFDEMLLRHASGLRLLAAPVHPGDSELISEAALSGVIARLRTLYDHVIIDGRPSFREFMLDLWENSDALVVPCPPEVISVLLTRALLDAFDTIGIDQTKTTVVLNQVSSRPRLSQAQVEKGLRRSVYVVPHGGDLLQHSVDAGKPIVLEGDNPSASALRQLAKQLLDRRARPGVAAAG